MSDNLVVTTGAAQEVPGTVNSFEARAWTAIAEARTALYDMNKDRPVFPAGSAAPGNVKGNITYNVPDDKPVWAYNFSPPGYSVPRLNLNTVNKSVIPKFTGTAPVATAPNLPVRPNPVLPKEPGEAPIVQDVVIPGAPILKTIADPKEWAINLPTAPVITIPTLNVTKPNAGNLTKPSTNFNWQEDPYTSQTLSEIEVQVSKYFSGGTGIPDIVWEAIWAKENDKENRAAIKQITEINEEWSSRGFQLPQGIQVAQVQEVRQELQSSAVSRARDIAIQQSTLEIENLKFAVQQGIALENLRGSWHQATVSRLLEATKFASELAISVFNADISFYNAQVQMYLAEIQIFEAELKAELADLELYKMELEGQKVIGELNQQQVQIYVSRIEALNIEIDRYNAILQGIKLGVEVDSAKIDAHRSNVEVFSEKIKAITSQYDAYSTAMQGAKIEAEIFGTNVSAFASTVQAYATQVDAESINTQVDISINKLKLEEYNTRIQGFIVELDSDLKHLQGEVSVFDSKTKVYNTGMESEKISIQAQASKYQADVSLANQTTQVNIANAQTNAKNALAVAGIIQQGLDSVASINGAYAGSAMAAVNIGMTMSDSASNSGSL